MCGGVVESKELSKKFSNSDKIFYLCSHKPPSGGGGVGWEDGGGGYFSSLLPPRSFPSHLLFVVNRLSKNAAVANAY